MRANNSAPVRCIDCAHFTKDEVGDGSGLGKCAEFTAYLAKNPSPAQQRKALSMLGNHNGNTLFWGGQVKDRDCVKFKPL